jgi:hypothetical protein
LILGTITGIGAMAHGIFETLQGNKPATDILERIGAFTILPTYLLAGISTIIASLLLIAWTTGFIQKKIGPVIFILLSLILIFTGGGVAIIIGFLITWAVSTRINKSLTFWRKFLSDHTRMQFAKYWLAILLSGFTFLTIGILIWVLFTPPGEKYQINVVDYICWSFLFMGFLFQILTIISGFARDIELNK